MTDDNLRALWRAHGGSFSGPIVETGCMPEAKLLVLLRQYATMKEFIEQIATPGSEPLNSAVVYRDKESRRTFMGVLRTRAGSIVDAIDAVGRMNGR